MFRFFLPGSALVLAFSWAAIPLLEALDVWIVSNPRPAHALHLVFIWAAGSIMFWAVASAASLPLALSIIAITGGATSNVLYRLLLGPVPDYIPLPFGAYGNIADLLIVLGGMVFFFFLWRVLREERRQLVQ